MKRLRRILVVLIALGMVVSLTMILPASAETDTKGSQKVRSSEFVLCNLDSTGEIEGVQVFDILDLKGDGPFNVRERKSIEGDASWQGVHGFKKPKVEGDYIVWEGLKAKGSASYVAGAKLSESMVEDVRTRIPLDLRFKYKFDGAPVSDLNEITGKSGRFELELTLRNTSKEKTRVTYKDPDTGQMVEDEVETYLPMVISPYDWYFDNRVFFNVEADPTGMVIPMPDFTNVQWNIPLFPPATQESHTIWVRADVKNFQMPPLTIGAAFLIPETNQEDSTFLLKSGLEQIYAGLKKLDEGVGEPEKEDTLLYGITAVHEGLGKLGAGLPEAKVSLDEKLITGVAQIVSGIGAANIKDTLLYAVNAVINGLNGIKAGIGSGMSDSGSTMLKGMETLKLMLSSPAGALGPTWPGGIEQLATNIIGAATPLLSHTDPNVVTAATNIVSLAQTIIAFVKGPVSSPLVPALQIAESVKGGLNSVKAGIGSESTSDTLLYAMAAIQAGLDKIKAGLSTGSLSNPGVKEGLILISEGLGEAIAGIGSSGTPDTLLYGTNAVKEGLASVGDGTGQLARGVYNFLKAFYMTDAQVAAITKRGEEYDHLLGKADDAENQVRFLFQTKPTYNYTTGGKGSWVVAIVLSLIIALILVGGGIMLSRRGTA
ncbi:MAG: hypothetical protein H5T73_07050 [Actinobacteria bacterium]|nr:hypothetical protein [Actinomycetota bacterium]